MAVSPSILPRPDAGRKCETPPAEARRWLYIELAYYARRAAFALAALLAHLVRGGRP